MRWTHGEPTPTPSGERPWTPEWRVALMRVAVWYHPWGCSWCAGARSLLSEAPSSYEIQLALRGGQGQAPCLSQDMDGTAWAAWTKNNSPCTRETESCKRFIFNMKTRWSSGRRQSYNVYCLHLWSEDNKVVSLLHCSEQVLREHLQRTGSQLADAL